MEGDTLRSKISQLLQRTRKAVRLYGSVDRSGSSGQSGLTVQQLEVWQTINTQLQRELVVVLENPNYKLLPSNLRSIRDRYFNEWRSAQAEVRSGQRELVTSAERGDFVRSAVIAQKLIQFKAREQACHAVVHELEQIVDKNGGESMASHLSEDHSRRQPFAGAEAGTEGYPGASHLHNKPKEEIASAQATTRSNVIHLRARNSSSR